MASKLTPQQSPQAPSSSFWQLISGVAHDLDLMLQDLFPDAIPSPLREEYGLTDDVALDHESFANHATLLEQFMRGAGPDATYLGPTDPGSEYRSSKSLFAETPTSDSCDGRTTPTSTSSPSPPPPAPPPRSLPPASLLHNYPGDYSANVQGVPASSSAGAQSQMVSSSSISSVQETSDGDSSHTSSSFAPCDIGLLERLIRTHPIWFLPGIGRAGAVHLLQGKDVGNFIVRQSSKPNTMALSVRLPEDKGPYVEHYLIETVGDAQLRLEGSDNNFHAIPMLVAHYCQCCDELPVQLSLPCPLAQAGSRQELSSLALLGQDFWLSSLVQSPAHAPSAGPFHSSGPVNNLPLHSTFKPAPSVPNGSSQSLALALNSSENLPDLSSPSSGSPPPPVAPKHQTHNAPPPPPPRSFLTSRTSSVSSLPTAQNAAPSETSTDLSSPSTNNDSKSQPTVVNGEKSEVVQEKIEDSDNKKVEKKIPRVAHYSQSNIVDLTPAYYKSSLADKISDYEDIWGNTVTKESSQKTKLKTFQPSSKNEDDYIVNLKRKNFEIFKRQESDNFLAANLRYTQGTQTDTFSTAAAMLDSSLSDMQNQIENKFDIKEESSPDDQENFSSPFYSEPVDSIPVNSTNSRKPALSDLDLLPQRLFNHRFSDPNLHWPQNASCRKIESTLDEERLASLSSSVDNIKGLGPSPQHRKQMSTQWVQELNQRISSHSTKKDCQTQVSINDLLMQKPEKKSSSPKKGKGHQSNSSAWPLDSSWEWMAHDDSSSDENGMPIPGSIDSKFPLHLIYKDADSQLGDTTTVEDLIALRSPELALPDIRPLTQSNLMRVSEYDNLDRPPDIENDVVDRQQQRVSEIVDDTATEFCEPWDSLRWERLLGLMIPETDILGDDDTVQREKMENHRNMILENNKRNEIGKPDITNNTSFEDNESNSTVSAYSDLTSEGNDDTSASDYPTIGSDRYRNKSFEERLEPLLAAQRVVALRNRCMSRIGENIRHYIFRLAEERDNTFAKSIEHFIQCTKESTETKPSIVMRNIRQFMSGIKNYLLKHGEGRFENLVQEERSKLRSDEFLDIDAVIEDSLHKLVIKPLKGYIYQLFVNEYTRNGSLKLLSDNIKFARTKTPEELGVRDFKKIMNNMKQNPEFKLPEGTSLEVVKHFLHRLQQAYSPLKKLENLLAAISTIYNSVQQDKIAQGKEHVSLGAGDFLPIFICVLVQCGLIAAEIEAEYMWGLLHPSLMAREGGYYLTTLSSAVHVLKSLQACSPESPPNSESSFDNIGGAGCSGRPYGVDIGSPRSQLGFKTPSPEPRLACIADLQGFLKIMIPDELTGSIISKTLPIKPNMTTKEVAKLIAHKFNVTNPQDYNLFKLVDGEETMLGDSECPQVIKADLMAAGSNCLFTYKRCDAKFIWPILEKSS